MRNRMSSAEMTLDPLRTAPSHACCSFGHTHTKGREERSDMSYCFIVEKVCQYQRENRD
jgi:hypothetical protein